MAAGGAGSPMNPLRTVESLTLLKEGGGISDQEPTRGRRGAGLLEAGRSDAHATAQADGLAYGSV
jgi:hypothetical protein